MTHDETHITHLISRLIAKRISADELHELSAWRDSCASHHAFVARCTADMLARNMIIDDSEYSVDAAYSRFESRVAKQRHGLWRKFMRIAALALIVILPLAGYVALQHQPDDVSLMTAPAGCSLQFDLPDGTHVTLGRGSSLAWTSSYGGSSRQVRLDGEGYFDVVHDARCPFTVVTSSAEIVDLGTQFRVNDSEMLDVVEVHVVEGAVAFRGKDASRATTLQHGTSARLDKQTGHLDTYPLMAESDLMRSLDHVMFDDFPLGQAAFRLSQIYGEPISVAEPLQHCRVNGVFDVAHDSLTQILGAFSLVEHATLSHDAQGYHLQ